MIGQSVGSDASPLSCFFSSSKKLRKAQETQSYQRFQCIGYTGFNTSGANGPRSLSRVKAGTRSALGERSHTAAYTAKHGAFWMGVVSLPSERFARFGNPARPGIRTANFAAFWPWSGVFPKNAESLRDSDALMRVAVPRRRGPAGLRDLFRFCRSCGLYALRSGPFRVCEARGGITTPGVLRVLPKRWMAACKSG